MTGKDRAEGPVHRGVQAVLPAVSAVALAVAVAAAAAPRPAITQAQSGKSFRVAKSGHATLRLSSRWVWTDLRLSSRVIELTPVEYFVDPGYREWIVDAREHGSATIRSVGKPACTDCTLSGRSFRVTIVVP